MQSAPDLDPERRVQQHGRFLGIVARNRATDNGRPQLCGEQGHRAARRQADLGHSAAAGQLLKPLGDGRNALSLEKFDRGPQSGNAWQVLVAAIRTYRADTLAAGLLAVGARTALPNAFQEFFAAGPNTGFQSPEALTDLCVPKRPADRLQIVHGQRQMP